jgi:hypothetical protein
MVSLSLLFLRECSAPAMIKMAYIIEHQCSRLNRLVEIPFIYIMYVRMCSIFILFSFRQSLMVESITVNSKSRDVTAVRHSFHRWKVHATTRNVKCFPLFDTANNEFNINVFIIKFRRVSLTPWKRIDTRNVSTRVVKFFVHEFYSKLRCFNGLTSVVLTYMFYRKRHPILLWKM